MVKYLKFATLLIVLGLILASACGDKNQLPEIITSDFSTTIPENPSAGQNLGMLSASTDAGSLTFTIKSGTPEGAMVVDATSGALTVAVPFSFDYEIRTSLSATVTVTNGSTEKDVNVLIILEDEKPLQTEIDKFVNNYKTQKFAFDGIFAMLGSHDCRLDDEMDISADGTYQYNGGRSLCGNEDDQRIKAGTWALDEKLRFVIFDRYEARKFQADINFLSDTMVALSGSYMGVPVSGEYVPR